MAEIIIKEATKDELMRVLSTFEVVTIEAKIVTKDENEDEPIIESTGSAKSETETERRLRFQVEELTKQLQKQSRKEEEQNEEPKKKRGRPKGNKTSKTKQEVINYLTKQGSGEVTAKAVKENTGIDNKQVSAIFINLAKQGVLSKQPTQWGIYKINPRALQEEITSIKSQKKPNQRENTKEGHRDRPSKKIIEKQNTEGQNNDTGREKTDPNIKNEEDSKKEIEKELIARSPMFINISRLSIIHGVEAEGVIKELQKKDSKFKLYKEKEGSKKFASYGINTNPPFDVKEIKPSSNN